MSITVKWVSNMAGIWKSPNYNDILMAMMDFLTNHV
jgi:hypothetical protein